MYNKIKYSLIESLTEISDVMRKNILSSNLSEAQIQPFFSLRQSKFLRGGNKSLITSKVRRCT